MFCFLEFLSLDVFVLRFSHVHANTLFLKLWNSSYFINMPLIVHLFFFCFCFWLITSEVAVNIHLCVFLCCSVSWISKWEEMGYLEEKCMLDFARLLNFYKVQLHIPYVPVTVSEQLRHSIFLTAAATFSLHLYLFSWPITAFSDVCFWKYIINWIINLAPMCVCMWGSEDGLSMSVLFLHNVCPRDWSQVVRHGADTYKLSHLIGPPCVFVFLMTDDVDYLFMCLIFSTLPKYLPILCWFLSCGCFSHWVVLFFTYSKLHFLVHFI